MVRGAFDFFCLLAVVSPSPQAPFFFLRDQVICLLLLPVFFEVFFFPSFENGARLPLLKKMGFRFSPCLLAWLAVMSDNRFVLFALFCTFRGCVCYKEAFSKVLASTFRVRVVCLLVSVAEGLFGICCLRAICVPFP